MVQLLSWSLRKTRRFLSYERNENTFLCHCKKAFFSRLIPRRRVTLYWGSSYYLILKVWWLVGSHMWAIRLTSKMSHLQFSRRRERREFLESMMCPESSFNKLVTSYSFRDLFTHFKYLVVAWSLQWIYHVDNQLTYFSHCVSLVVISRCHRRKKYQSERHRGKNQHQLWSLFQRLKNWKPTKGHVLRSRQRSLRETLPYSVHIVILQSKWCME